MAQQYLLGSTDLDRAVLARVGDKASLDTFPELVEVIRARCGDDAATLFAEPVRGFNRTSQTQNVTWFGAFEGTPYPFNQLDPSALKPVADLLRQRLSALMPLLSDPAWGPRLASCLYVLTPGDVLSVAGKPVIQNWGMVPLDIAGSEEAREAHYRRTLEPYAPRIPLPPFSGEEGQSFVHRLAQLAARDRSVGARPMLGAGAAAELPASAPPITAPPTPPPTAARLNRPWLAPLIATAVAATILAAIEILHLLVYPPAGPEQSSRAAIDTQRAVNRALEQRLTELQDMSGKVCQATPGANPPGGGDFQKILPQPLDRSEATPAPSPEQPQPKPTTIAALLNAGTVLVVTRQGLGSGFFISDRDIVTNHHVVGDFSEVEVGNRAIGGLVDAKVIAVGSGRTRGTQDLAVLEIEHQPGTEPLKIASVPAQLARVTAAGFPGAVLETMQLSPHGPLPEVNLTQGIVASRQQQQPDGIGTIIHTATLGHGNSGGPLVDEGGCAVGVNSWLAFDAAGAQIFQTYDQALDSNEIRKFLDEKNIKYVASDTPCPALMLPAPAAPPPGAPARAAQ